jgi:hypothetical protein
MLHKRFVLLVPLALGVGIGLAGDGVQAIEPVAKARPAVLVQGDGFEVTPVARRRRGDDETDGAWSLLTMRGTFDCPGGYQPVYQGNIYSFVQKGVEVPQFGDVEPYCWPLQAQQPMEATFLGSWEKIALCVVCARQPGTALTGAPPITSTPVPGGGTDSGVPDRNDLTDDDPDQPETNTSPIPGA